MFLDKSDGSPLKATDFGLAVRHNKGDRPLQSRAGTPAYMASGRERGRERWLRFPALFSTARGRSRPAADSRSPSPPFAEGALLTTVLPFPPWFTILGIQDTGALPAQAPEVILQEYDQRADIYSAGVLAFQLLTVRHIFQLQGGMGPTPPTGLYPSLPPAYALF